MLKSLRRFENSEVAKQRHKIMTFFDRYGEKATKEAFGADRILYKPFRKPELLAAIEKD